MAARVSATKRTTLYRFAEGTGLADGLLPRFRKPLPGFTLQQVTVDSADGLLLEGTLDTACEWAADVTALTAVPTARRNRIPGCALILRTSPTDLWALTWGAGWQFLDTEHIDFRFGARMVARTALSGEIRSITRTLLDHRARTDRTCVPNGSTMWDLGVDGYGEVVSRIESRARISGLTFGDKDLQLRAADSLSLPLGRTPNSLCTDLAVLRGTLDHSIRPGLESIEQLVALKAKDPMVAELDRALVRRLLGASDEPIGLGRPHERMESCGPAVTCKVTGFGNRRALIFDGLPDIDDVLKWFAGQSPESARKRLGSIGLQLHAEPVPPASSAVSPCIPLQKWLAFEVHDGARRYCLHNGAWYRMDDRYLERIDQRVADILAQPASISLPPWHAGESEGDYNIRAAAALGGYSLDKKMISTPLHTRGIESRDIFVPPGVLVHVKRGSRSTAISHLLAQALVASEALARDENARQVWKSRVASESGGTVTDAEVAEIVLAIGSPRQVTANSLFTFSKVNLVRQFDLLRHLAVDVRVISIPT